LISGVLLLTLAASTPLQEEERPSFDFVASGKFSELVRKLEEKTKCRIHTNQELEDKEVSVSVKQVRFFEALDALCRAHGAVRYLYPEHTPVSDELTLGSGDWIDYPSSYHGDFKIVITHLLRTRGGSIEGSGAWSEMGLVLLGPPWVRVSYGSGAKDEWTLEEARDQDGKDLLLKEKEDPGFREFAKLMGDRPQHGNFADQTFTLKEFDVHRKLQSVAGKVELTALKTQKVRIELEAGKSVEVPGGTLAFDELTELEKFGHGSEWRVSLTFTPTKGTGSKPGELFEESMRCDGSFDWTGRLRWRRNTVEIETFLLPRKPAWLELRARTGEQKIRIPFRFRDVSFKKEF
jgi:hypothetical protein